MASYPSRRGSNFCRFLASDVEKITIFWESTLCLFSDARELVQNKIPKKNTFLGNFPGYIFHHISLSWLCFYTVFSGWSTTFSWASEKTSFFGRRKNDIFLHAKKMFFGREKNVFRTPKKMSEKITFFRVRQYGAFWLQRSHCGNGYHIFPPTGLNLETADISTSKLANSKQQMSKSIQQFLKCTLISSPLVRWKWPTQVGTLGILWWGWELGMMQSTISAVFSGVRKNVVFSGHGSRMTVRKNPGYLAGWLSGWLAGWLSGWLAKLLNI